MIARLDYETPPSALRAACAMLAGATFMFLAFAASAQQGLAPVQTPPPVQATPPADAAPPAPAANKPGFLDAINRWFDKSAADLKDTFNRTGKAAKDATEALVKLPGVRVIDGRELCTIAANGSPDCLAAAEKICKGRGFGSGKSLETQSTQKCPPRVWLSGRPPAEGECTVETFVIRSVCQ